MVLALRMRRSLLQVTPPLLAATEGSQTMSVQEHATIMRSMSNFNTSSVKTLRRELVGHGAVISNLANVAQRERQEIAIIARNVITSVTATRTEEATNTVSINISITINANVATIVDAITLSKSWLTLVGDYKCLCRNCGSSYYEELRKTMIEEGKKA